MKQQHHWYHYLWLWSIFYFSMSFVNILFAWLGLISFCLPLLFAIIGGNKLFCNRYCDRGQLLRVLGSQVGLSRRHEMPAWLKSQTFRYAFMIFFFAMFGSVIYTTWLVGSGASSVKEAVMLLWSINLPWHWTYTASVSPWQAQFAFGLYSLMMTSEVIALAAMLWFKPRSWCVFCPMGTLTQTICRVKSGSGRNN
ncbi:4Fe-4S binding protein [Mitsuokella sp. WILCCON 0060]|uniref:4Fe-4S binding protein n=1 Tax=unclassified Mitsuokella TaxID=2637239 RepID=UPI003EFC5D76